MSGRMVNNLIEVRQGDSFVITLHLLKNSKDVDLSGITARMQVRDSAGIMQWELTGESLDATQGRLAFLISPEQSSIEEGSYLCDIQLEMPDGSINTIFPANVNQVGTFKITKQITK